METPTRTGPVLGIDAGKRSRWTCLVAAEREIVLNAPVANRERDLNELFSRAPGVALVVVDQVRNIGSLALRRAARGGPQQAVWDLRIVGHGVPPGEQEAEKPAHFLVQLPGQERQPVRRILSEMPGPGDVARQDAQGDREGLKVIYAIMRDRVPYAS